jgi:glycerol-3-phosphate acyltransferase PlsX
VTQNNAVKRIRIALDVMGGDLGPPELVKGAIEAARRSDVEMLLVGDKAPVELELAKYNARELSIRIVPSEGKILDDEHPILGLRHKPQSSISVCTKLLRDGQADAVISMGSTGASMASATLDLGLMEGLERPALGGNFLGQASNVVLVDLGASVDCRPRQLLDFGVLGCVFAEKFLNVPNPRVGLLSVGSEEAKGNRQVRETQELFKKSGLNYIGNVEGFDFFTGKADVIVCDGFVGNVVLKFAEGMVKAMFRYAQQEMSKSVLLGMFSPMLNQLREKASLSTRTGAPLFGVNGVVIIGHGASRAEAVVGSVATVRLCIERGLVENTKAELAQIRSKIGNG